MMKISSLLKSIPNLMTVLRIAMIPIVVISFAWAPNNERAKYAIAIIFFCASITDYLDGALARLWKAHTNFGRMLDPIADKMLVISTMIMMLDKKMAPVIPILVIVCREIFVSGMREYMAEMKIDIKVNILGKFKTVLQMCSILILMVATKQNHIIYGEIALWLATLLTVISGYAYFVQGMKKLNK